MFFIDTSVQDIPDRFTEIMTFSGIKIVKKSTLCWFLGNGGNRISPDRLRRVMGNSHNCPYINHPQFVPDERDTINIGQWCLFLYKENPIIGNVIGFSYIKGSRKQKQYTLDGAPVKPPGFTEKGIKVLCNFYKLNLTLLEPTTMDEYYVNINNYVLTLPKPDYLTLNEESVIEINKYLK